MSLNTSSEFDRATPAANLPSPAPVAPDALTAPGELVKRRRGRPPGQKMRIVAEQLRYTHFLLLRFLMNGIALRKAWELSMGLADTANDERHFARRAREITAQVRAGAEERGLQGRADVALAGLLDLLPKPAAPPPPLAPAIPSLDDWIAQKCEDSGEDPEDTRYSEWQERYNDEFALDQIAAPLPATAIPERAGPPSPADTTAVTVLPELKERLAALTQLATELSTPPALTDAIGVWLSDELARRLAGTQVDGKPLPLLTLGNLIGMVNVYHHRWWVHVPRLGANRAGRLVEWLTPLAEQLGQPLSEMARKPFSQITRERAAELAVLDSRDGGRHARFGMVPLDRLAVPPELSGRDGTFRAARKTNVFDVDDDLAAIFKWLERHQGSPRTIASYQLIIERFYLWCLLKKRKPLSSLSESDFREYRAFMEHPPADWIQTRRAGRGTAAWRPFKGPASPESIMLNFTVLASMIKGLHDGGYLSANAIKGAMPAARKKLLAMKIDRSFNDAQWSWLMACWREMYLACGPSFADGEVQPLFPDNSHRDQQFIRAAGLRRTRLVLELGSTTGLRLLEFVTTRRGAVKRRLIDGAEVWMVSVLGKGDKEREVPLFDDIKAMLDQHHLDMEVAQTHFDASSHGFRTLRNPAAQPPAPVDEGGMQSTEVALIEQAPALPSPPLTGSSANPAGDILSGEFDRNQLPLVGALRRASRPKVMNTLGLVVDDDEAPKNTDRYGALDPTALYQSLKRFLTHCARRAETADAGVDVQALLDASTHWMRHFFANSAVNDKVDLAALRDALGHASLTTTSVYVRTERARMVSELTKMRRRT